MNKIITRTIESKLTLDRGSDGTGRTISGYAVTFNQWSKIIEERFREKINHNAFAECDCSDTIACFNHNSSSIMARTSSGTLSLKVDDIGVFFQYEAPNTTAGNDLVELVARGDVDKCSFRAIVKSGDIIQRNEKQDQVDFLVEIMKVTKLLDVSPVVHAAYPSTNLTLRSIEDGDIIIESDDAKDNAAAARLRDYEFLSLKK